MFFKSKKETQECATEEVKACCRIAALIEKLKKPFVQYDFDIIRSVHADEESEPVSQNGAKGTLKIRLLDVILALTAVVAIISLFSKNDD